MIGKFATALAMMACVSCFVARMNAQLPDGPAPPEVPPQPETKDSGYSQPIYTPPPFDPSLYVAADPGLQSDANTAALHQQMASTLNGLPSVPQDRLDYFSAYTNSKTDTISNWAGQVEDVQANCYGYLVTIRIQPGISSTTSGPATILLGPNYSEQYQVGNGQVTYQGFLDPDGTAGQQFGRIGL